MVKKRNYVRQFFAYKDYFKSFKRTLSSSALQKKTQKTPLNQLQRAERIMKEYFNEKNKLGGK